MSDCKERVWRRREAAERIGWTPRLTSVPKVLYQYNCQRLARKGLREEITLGEVALHVAQLRQLLGGLHPFGDRLQAKGVRQLDHRRHDLPVLRRVVYILPEPGDERTVDLQEVDREALEV